MKIAITLHIIGWASFVICHATVAHNIIDVWKLADQLHGVAGWDKNGLTFSWGRVIYQTYGLIFALFAGIVSLFWRKKSSFREGGRVELVEDVPNMPKNMDYL